MKKHWLLPDEKFLNFTGPEWLLHVVALSDPESAARVILILWRAWFVRDKWTHEHRWLNESASENFLLRYSETLFSIQQQGQHDKKSKGVLQIMSAMRAPRIPKTKEVWTPPEEGWIKVNVDGAMSEESGEAGVGVVIRDHRGTVLLSAWKALFDAGSAEEVEALACREGLHLAAEWIQKPTVLESDCSTIIGYLSKKQKQRAPSFFPIQDALREAGKLPRGWSLGM